jgi:hypothetical protein
MKKYIYLIVAALIIMLVAYLAGLHSGQKQARQECIDQVAQNCKYICGVGADFYFPDKYDPPEREELPEDLMAFIIERGN